MVDLSIIEVRNQLISLKIAHDEGFGNESLLEELRLCDEYEFFELLFDTNITLVNYSPLKS